MLEPAAKQPRRWSCSLRITSGKEFIACYSREINVPWPRPNILLGTGLVRARRPLSSGRRIHPRKLLVEGHQIGPKLAREP